eukprot:TRINITY_DN4270_c0_g1_i1.p1 TRINITY_DN4270_c0_g1~~TRINITY_DN4270_c0_g1_i1.p1  ORF type:complete len:573 (+),score=80.13 TRINITY_DN4270_c0_g1_i1:53-1771(+)
MVFWHRKPLQYVLSSEDTQVDKRRKLFLLVGLAGAIILGAMIALFPKTKVGTAAGFMNLSVAIGGIAFMVVFKAAPDTLFEVLSYMFTVTLILMDWEGAANSGLRLWPSFLIIIDIVLACETNFRIPRTVLACGVCWLVVTAFESGFRFGLYDLQSIDSGKRLEICDCENPPCPIGMEGTAMVLLPQLLIFLLDFWCTRWFATVAAVERKRMESSIEAAETIAYALAEYNLDDASTALDTASPDLPTPLLNAYQKILMSLKDFRPYLDQSCLQTAYNGMDDQTSTISKSTLDRPSLIKKRLSLVAVNIKNSLNLIETDKEGFLSTHEFILESATAAFSNAKGVIDNFIGDKIYTSFNASHTCSLHAMSAVKSVVSLFSHITKKSKACNAGIVVGTAQCGYLGCKALRRFCVLGKLTTYLTEVERYGRRKQLDVVCDRSTALDVGNAYEKRLILESILVPFIFEDEALFHYEILWDAHVKMSCTSPVTDRELNSEEEWMYELEAAPGQKWEIFNDAGIAFLQHDVPKVRHILSTTVTLSSSVQPFVDILKDALDSSHSPSPPITWITPNSHAS